MGAFDKMDAERGRIYDTIEMYEKEIEKLKKAIIKLEKRESNHSQ